MNVDDYAQKIFQYMRLGMELKPADAILGLGALDTRIAAHAAQLMLDGYGKLLIFSGGYGKITKDTNTKTEAETFRDVALDMGVPPHKILIEPTSTNTGENIRFTEKLLQEKSINVSSLIIVVKPYMERRAYATFKKQWLDENIELIVTSPPLTYEEHFNDKIPKELFLNLMVGDLQRIKEFPKRDFQIEQEIPADVWEAFEGLAAMGYDKHLLK